MNIKEFYFLLNLSERASETLKKICSSLEFSTLYRCRRSSTTSGFCYPYVDEKGRSFLKKRRKENASSHNIIKRGQFFFRKKPTSLIQQN